LQGVRWRDRERLDLAAHPYTLAPVQHIEHLDFHPEVTFFIGENGSGKSTVLEALALASGFGVEGGTKNVQLNSGDQVSGLCDAIRLRLGLQKPRDGYYLRAESFYNVATHMDQLGYLEGYGGRSLHTRSHGEAFLILLQQKLRGQGLYFLDEPEAALSPMRQRDALQAIHALVSQKSQFVIATHSPILLSYPHAKRYWFDASGVREIEFDDIPHVQTTREYLQDVKRSVAEAIRDRSDGAPGERTFGPY
jgi:predicted ATPase